MMRLPFDPAVEVSPVWSPDSSHSELVQPKRRRADLPDSPQGEVERDHSLAARRARFPWTGAV